MNAFRFLKDKLVSILLFFFVYFVILLLFLAFRTEVSLIISVGVLLFSGFCFSLLFDYFRKKSFYNNLFKSIENLDKAYLVLETLRKPSFYDGEILWDSMYEVNKSMLENVNSYVNQVSNFKEYVEMWIHEVKIPLSSLILKCHNNKDKISKDFVIQVNRTIDYLEQILYYVRSENASEDYLIKKVSLDKCVNEVLLKNKDYLLDSKIDLEVKDIKEYVYTDQKWLEFIINQVISNSIKYMDKNKDKMIKIYINKDVDSVSLVIEDNGIGISEEDLPRVFNKSFTGSNGRGEVKSTGMGLYIARNLCNKLGHNIKIESKKGEFTKVFITISNNKFYEVVK